MRRILLFLMIAVTPVRAAERGVATAVVPVAVETNAARVARQQRAELDRRMNAVLEASQKTLASLETMIAASANPATTFELERRMAQVKFDTTIDLLRVQASFAREVGRVAQADAIDLRIDAILHPKLTR